MCILYLRAPQDRNGNPRRCWVRVHGRDIRDVWPEEYLGIKAVPEQYRAAAQAAPWFDITVREYNRLVREK